MPTVQVKLKDFAKVLGEFSDKRIEDLKAATVSGVVKSIPDVVRSSPVDTGQYASSWDFTETEKSVILGNYAPHAPIIELGARPFTPPLPPLLAWSKRVLQDPSQPPKYSSQVWALAKGVQKKIQAVGMEPRHVLQKALPGIIENIRAEMQLIG